MPIVLFLDPVMGLDCDLCASNSLAIRNTALLRAYAQIDPRVRLLAYVVKYWASRRGINSPPGGTLSSYGYLLMLLRFLQRRPQPLIPCLQALPPDWDGSAFHPLPRPAHRLPRVMMKNADGKLCDTYFYDRNVRG